MSFFGFLSEINVASTDTIPWLALCVRSTSAEPMIWMPPYSVPFQNESPLFVGRKGGTVTEGVIRSKLR